MAIPRNLVKGAAKKFGIKPTQMDNLKNGLFRSAVANTRATYGAAKGFRDPLSNLTKKGTLSGSQVFKDSMWNIAHAATKEGGGLFANYGKQALIGAGVGSVANGTMEWGQGGSFWEGAKSGAVTGALWGAGLGAAKASVGLPGSAGGTLKSTGARMSKQVQAMFRSGEASQLAAKKVLNKKG